MKRGPCPGPTRPVDLFPGAAVSAAARGKHGRLTLSLVAVDGGAVVGHIAFSPVSVLAQDGRIAGGVALGPMAVEPARQRSGIGGRLITAALERLTAAGHPFCVVVGHADYCPRFGFTRAGRFGIRWEGEVPDQFFFARELASGGLGGVHGVPGMRPNSPACEGRYSHRTGWYGIRTSRSRLVEVTCRHENLRAVLLHRAGTRCAR